MSVTRCICADRSFAELQQLARRERLSLDALARRTGATLGCGLCRTYVQRALATGQCAFAVDGDAGRAGAAFSPALSTNSHAGQEGVDKKNQDL